MRKWKTKLFANDRWNFYGWLVVALLNVSGSLFFVAKAIVSTDALSGPSLLLIAVYLVITTHFLLAVQRYLSPLARKLDEDIKTTPTSQPAEDIAAPIRLVR